ncbi:hypothetical protein MP228_010173 [Amoeboaphelidium protococcarum]|nr:hypothetical protein MP228_010173 [Amoeboaphelidium protococcarum]
MNNQSILSQYADILNDKNPAPPLEVPSPSTAEQESAQETDNAINNNDDTADINSEDDVEIDLTEKLRRRVKAKIVNVESVRQNFETIINIPAIVEDSEQTCIIDFRRMNKHQIRKQRGIQQQQGSARRPVAKTVVDAKIVEFSQQDRLGGKKKSKSLSRLKKQSYIIKDDDIGDYDYEDPFIDDEQDFYLEQMLHRPEVEGYFAWKGAVPTRLINEDELLEGVSSDDEVDGEQAADGDRGARVDPETAQPNNVDNNNKTDSSAKSTPTKAKKARKPRTNKETGADNSNKDGTETPRKKRRRKEKVTTADATVAPGNNATSIPPKDQQITTSISADAPPQQQQQQQQLPESQELLEQNKL